MKYVVGIDFGTCEWNPIDRIMDYHTVLILPLVPGLVKVLKKSLAIHHADEKEDPYADSRYYVIDTDTHSELFKALENRMDREHEGPETLEREQVEELLEDCHELNPNGYYG